MVRRTQRQKQLYAYELARFVERCSNFHNEMTRFMTALQPTCPQAKAVNRLTEAVRASIREVSGEEPPWMREAHGAGIGWRDPEKTRPN